MYSYEDMQSVFAWSETGPSHGISFSAAHQQVSQARIAIVSPVAISVMSSIGIPSCISAIILSYLPPSRLEFAQYCYFAEYISNSLIIPVDATTLHYVEHFENIPKRFMVVECDAFDNVRSMILRIPFWDNADPDSEQLNYIDTITVPYFEKVFAGHADTASKTLDDLKPYWHSSLGVTNWADECRRIAECAKHVSG
jgi:hypothetical protein